MNFNQWPEEIAKKPKPLIALTGLDIDNNMIHKSIWEGFSKLRRQDRAQLNFSLFPIKHEYQKCKSKRVTYEWYVPKGILKTRWIIKHMEEVPAMIVFFYDMDWDDVQWKEKITDCSNLVNIVKKNIQGRASKIVVVLVQKKALMPEEDTSIEQKAQYLCQICDLQGNRNLFVLPTTESLFGYITRLEREFQDIANIYYQSQIKKVKSHKEALNKTTHQLLFIRHHFKIALFQEFRQETSLASKNYKQAYAYLLELRMLDTHILEIKTVAGYINYKICCLSFQNNASDAISQFRRHTDFFKGMCGLPDLAYEHEAWISKQFEVMGDLFRDAIRQGLTALTTQHPGLYYEEAALHAIARKRFSHPNMITSARRVNRYYNVTDASFILSDDSSVQTISLDLQQSFEQPLEFFGQRHWRQGKQSIEPPDSNKEKEAIMMLQIAEKKIDHSKIIIPLLKNSMEHYQRYKANRMKLMSCVLMGEEFMSFGDYGEALKCFYKVFNDYRSEKWYSLLTSALLNSLKCTYLTAKMPDYISICLELIDKNIDLSTSEKIRIQNNLYKVLSNEIPEPECDIHDQQNEMGSEIWKKRISEFDIVNVVKEEFCINMNELASSVDCKVVFPSLKYSMDKCLYFSIYLRCTAIQGLQIGKINLNFLDCRYNERYSLIDYNRLPSKLEPYVVNEFKFTIIPIADEDSHTIKVDKVFVLLGDDMNYCHAYLQWNISMEEYLRKTYQPSKPDVFKTSTKSLSWSSILVTPFVELIPRASNFFIEIIHSNPILVNERYPIKISITNNESTYVYSIQVSIFLEDNSVTTSNHSLGKINFLEKLKTENTNVSVKSWSSKRIEFEVTSLGAGEQISEIICATATSPGNVQLHLEVEYKIKITVANHSGFCQCTKSEVTELNGIQPFEVMTKLLSISMIPMKDILAGDPFLLQITTFNVSPIKLEIISTNIQFTDEMISLDDPEIKEDSIINESVNSLESACEVKILQVLQNDIEDPTFVSIGKYSIQWRRCDYGLQEFNDQCFGKYNSSVITLPDCSLDLAPLTVDLDMDSHAVCKTPFILIYILRNRTLYPLEVEVQLDMCDNFMYSGIKFIQIRILPQSIYPLHFNLLPVISGYLALPKFRVKIIGSLQFLTSFTSDENSNINFKGMDMTTSKDINLVAQMANLERQFEEKFLSRLPQSIFVKPSGESLYLK